MEFELSLNWIQIEFNKLDEFGNLFKLTNFITSSMCFAKMHKSTRWGEKEQNFKVLFFIKQ